MDLDLDKIAQAVQLISDVIHQSHPEFPAPYGLLTAVIKVGATMHTRHVVGRFATEEEAYAMGPALAAMHHIPMYRGNTNNVR